MLKLDATKREVFGRKNAARRVLGEIPGVVYGGKEDNQSVFVSSVDFKKVFKEAGESSIISLNLAGKPFEVLIQDVQFDSVSDEPIHVDFYVIKQDQEIEVETPLVFVGVSPAVKELGGSLLKVLHELPTSALPKDLPHDIEVDISSLVSLDSQILVKDLVLPKGVKATADPEEVVALISEATEEIATEPVAADLSTIEVEKKGKKEVDLDTEKES